VLLADQASKLWIQQHFSTCDDTSLPLVPGWLAFAYTCNKGAAFGLLANETLLFVLIALVIIGVLVAYVRFLPAHRPWLRLSLGLQLGGALGNLLDRLRQGYVVDFISVKAWPVFPSSYAMEKLVVTLLVCPRNEQVTVAVPPVPDDCMCQVHPTTPLLPTVRAEPSNDRGPSPVE
jgi:signal peptidase II